MSDKPKKAAAKKASAVKTAKTTKPVAKKVVKSVKAPKAKTSAVAKAKPVARKVAAVKKPAAKKAATKPKAVKVTRKKAQETVTTPELNFQPVDRAPAVELPVDQSAVTAPPAPAPIPAPVAQHPEAQSPQAQVPAGHGPRDAQDAHEPQGQEGGGSRRKARWERWKERRERFKAEKMARRLNGGGQPAQPNASSHQPRPPQDEEPSMPPPTVLGPPEPVAGVLELNPKGQGFLRLRERSFAQHPADPFVHPDTIRQLGLREGMWLEATAQKGPRGLLVTAVREVDGRVPESVRDLPLFEELKAINPNKRISFETSQERVTTRVLDMFTPVGRGQRGLIVAPPRTGKTTLLQHIAEAVVQNHPGMKLMILLVDERPEEVTEFKRIFTQAEIYASSNDQDVRSHTRIATLAIERAKRLVECGEHVFMLMDSITRLARAFNNAKSGGATMSGGMGVGAMEIPRRLFAAARNTRGAGSLTILATALIETGSRMDDLIFLEFKGTGNMELVLDRKLAEQYYYPAVNIFKSGTRREELLLPPFQLDKIHMLRRGLAGGKPIDAIQRVITLCERYPGNAQMLVDLPGRHGA